MTSSRGAQDAPLAPPALQGCIEACRRCETVVLSMAESDDAGAAGAYRAVGPHLRHCLDHFDCLLRGLDRGVVDYDDRGRREDLETDPQAMLGALRTVIDRLMAIEPGTVQRKLRLRQEAAPGGIAELESSLERELIFLSGHAIHHIAIVRLIAETFGVRLPPGLDMAYSTASYVERQYRGTPAARS